MWGVLLQSGVQRGAVEYLILLALTLIAITTSAFIVFQAYRGARRNESRRMLYLAVGLALLTFVPFTLSLVLTALSQPLQLGPRLYSFYLPVTTRLVELCGLGSLLYSLYIDR
ncbi:hypothetical protein ACFQL1_07070 [Halomicroarcula sp. GCM10025709]|uniref:DUF7521 family protein n=1 Tax=Haloarcula TaxID=2237 RepID=UPI0024C2A770|nr:hypothetical protein [Halomicroarcula sp. YJ-61-S]